jgi:glutathione S-transferase
MKLYWSPRTRAFRIVWLLEELGRPYERKFIDIRDQAARADPEFRAASPMGKVPALIDGPVKLWDSGAICIYVADAYPQAGLGVPIGDPLRGAFLQWAAYTNAVMEPAMGERVNNIEVNPLRYGHGSFDLMIDTLAAGLTPGPWILGQRFTAPDVLLGSGVHYMDLFSMLPDRPELRAYAERCRARPAFQRTAAFEAAA